jgi:tRNA(Arg) A34 adenosine deaminase TadA
MAFPLPAPMRRALDLAAEAAAAGEVPVGTGEVPVSTDAVPGRSAPRRDGT